MNAPRSIGLPRMMKERGERRIFLPDFVRFLTELGCEVYMEEGYWRDGGLSLDDFSRQSPRVQCCGRDEVFTKDLVLVLRAPERHEFDLLGRKSCLISMLHYGTRPWRVQRLQELGLRALSLDSITDENNLRLVENMKAVAWNGIDAAFTELEREHPRRFDRSEGPISVLVLGTGIVGKHAVEAGTKMGSLDRYEHAVKEGGDCAIVLCAGRAATARRDLMKSLFGKADILVDATRRRNPLEPVVPNGWIAWLPSHAVIADLAVDPYLPHDTPPVVRGIEGIPQGNLDRYIFHPEDPDWKRSIPEGVPTANRRTVASCYSWPGIHPRECMEHYGRQLRPFMELLIEKGYDALSPEGGYFERALYRATLRARVSPSE
jgi:alanine dehydrogenase